MTAFGLVWWLLPPVLYADAGAGPDAENVRVKAITARTFEVTERSHFTDRLT